MLNTVCIVHKTLNPSYVDICWVADEYWSTAEMERLKNNPCKFLSFPPAADPGPLRMEPVCSTGWWATVASFLACLVGIAAGYGLGSL